MVPIPPAESPEVNVVIKIARLTFLQTQTEQVSNTLTQPMSINTQTVHFKIKYAPQQPIHCYHAAIYHDNTRTKKHQG